MPLLSRKPKTDPEQPGKLKQAPDIPPEVDERIKRGVGRLRELAPGRNECWEFFRGNTYTIRTKENQLVVTASGVSTKGGDPPHRVKTRRPILTPFVRQEVSREQIAIVKAWLDTQQDTDLQALGYSANDVAVLKSAYTDLNNLGKVAHGQQAQASPNDFFFWANKLTGVQ